MAEIVSKNNVLTINTVSIGIHITEHGSDWLWAVFSLFGLAMLINCFFVFYHEKKGNLFKHYLFVGPLLSTFFSAYSYYSLASNLGWAGVPTEFNHIDIGDNFRQVFYARFIGWFCAFPPLFFLFELNAQAQSGLKSYDIGALIQSTIVNIIAYETFIVSILIGAVVSSTYKWGYWTFGSVALLFGLFRLLKRQLFGVTSSGRSIYNVTVMCFFFITSILYPVSWALSEGGNVIQPDSEAVFYGILDLINFWIIPFVVVFDAIKTGKTPEDQEAALAAEKTANIELPETRVSGETA